MRTGPLLLLLALVGVIAYRARVRAGGELEPGASVEVLDARTASALRAVELSLARQGIAERDGFLEPPLGGPVEESPFPPAALAALAHWRLAQPGLEPATAGVAEPALERWIAGLGPWLGACSALVLFLAAYTLGASPHRALGGLVAAALVALSPAAIDVAARGRFDVVAVHVLAFALVATTAAQLATARQSIDVLQAGLTAGLFAGFALLCGVPAAVYVPCLWIAAFALARRAVKNTPREGGEHGPVEGAVARQAGLFLALVSALLATFGASRLAGGVAHDWLQGASELSFAAGLPFLFGSFGAEHAQRRTRWMYLVGVVLAVALTPLGLRNLARGLQLTEPAAVAASLHLHPGPLATEPLAWIALAALVALRVVRPLEPAAARRTPVPGAALAAASVGALLSPALLPLFAVACALYTGVALGELAARRPRSSAPAWAGLAAIVLVAGGALSRAPRAADSGARTVATALRMLRDEPWPGPWNGSQTAAGYGVLAPEAWAPLVAYHARRPAVRADALLAGTDAQAVADALRLAGGRYVLAGGATVAQWETLRSRAGTDVALEDTLLWRLSTLVPDEAPEAQLFVLERALGARDVAAGGETYTVPEVALYSLRTPALAGELGPQWRAR